MSVTKQLPKLEHYCYQDCPLCGRTNMMVVHGMVSITPDELAKVPDKGYAFCNCKNIWYTDWSNIEQQDYFKEDYAKDHHFERHETAWKNFWKEYSPLLKEHGNGGKKLLDIGCITDYLVDAAAEEGYEVTGTDIERHEHSRCRFIIGDFDIMEIEEKFDVIFTNHVLEHFHYPLRAMKRLYEMLEDDGIVFVSMPDPFQIPWERSERWNAWSLHQHYIMWDMDAFCDEMENLGFTTIFKKRNLDGRWLQDYHLLFKK